MKGRKSIGTRVESGEELSEERGGEAAISF